MKRNETGSLASQVGGLVLVRFLLVAMLALLAWSVERTDGLAVNLGLPLGLLAGGWALTLLYSRGMRLGPPLGVILSAQVALDLIVETVLIASTGGVRSPFVILYFLTIFTAGMYLYQRGAFLTAFGALAAFSGVTAVVGTGGGQLLPPARAYYEVGVHGGAFFLLALFSGLLAHRSRKSQEVAKSAAEELQRVVTSTDQIMANMPIGVMGASADGKIVRTNRAAREMLGVPASEDLIGRDLGPFLGTFAPQLVDALEAALLTRRWAIREEILIRRGTEEQHPIGVSITPLVHEGDELEGVIVTFTDLKEIRRMEREMRRSEQLANLGELAAGVAHELRNPLASISGAVQMLRDEFRGEGEEAELMDLIVSESDRLNTKIDGILDYTRDHSASRDVHDVSQTLREVIRLLHHDQTLSMGKNILMEFPENQSFLAEVEEEGMKQVFFNLARNALEAMGVGGILRVTGESPGNGRIHIVFKDTGGGIPAHELEHVFKPFHTTKEGGTGLGLAIANRIVVGNRGAIQIRSTPGVGTAITVELPAHRGSSPDASRPKKEKTPTASTEARS